MHIFIQLTSKSLTSSKRWQYATLKLGFGRVVMKFFGFSDFDGLEVTEKPELLSKDGNSREMISDSRIDDN